MAIRIEQSLQQTTDAYALLSRVDLDHVRVAASSVISRNRPSTPLSNLGCEIGFEPDRSAIDGSVLLIVTEFSCRVRDQSPGTPPPPVVELTVHLEASYNILEPDYTPSDAEIDAFRRGNAVFNCWPYFREFAASMFTRMGFPPPSVPFLRLVPLRDSNTVRDERPSSVKKSRKALPA